MSEPAGLTLLLHLSQQGDQTATDRLMPLVYDGLRGIAMRLMRQERPGHTLSATGLVHECYLRLFQAEVGWQDRSHFFRLASTMMRRILVDHAKSRRREKRGGVYEKISLDDPLKPIQVADPSSAAAGIDVLELDEALAALAGQDARKASIVELIYFGGLTYEEAAEVTGISPATLHRQLRLAKAWLHAALSPSASGAAE